MVNDVEYEPLSVEDADTGVYRRNILNKLPPRHRLRVYIGGLLFIGLGIYFIWKTAVVLLGLFGQAPISHPLKDARYLFVFGDSYSTIGYNVHDPPSSETHPLGNPASPGQGVRPNWVDYIVWQYNQSVILGYDFAVWGDTIQGVEQQVRDVFLPNAGQKPSWAPWSGHDSLFITWIGINDVARGLDIHAQLTLLFQLQDSLYHAGARNFVFLTVPPFERSPRGIQSDPDAIRARVEKWNELLMTFAKDFFIGHEGTSTTIYETSKIFNTVLDEPKRYGFKDSISSCREADCPWIDNLHPSSEFHRILAADLATFLNSI